MILPLTDAACAIIYTLLAAIILVQKRPNRTSWLLAAASLVTTAWSAAAAMSAKASTAPSLLEVARTAAWYLVTLHLYRLTAGDERRVRCFGWLGLVGFTLAAAIPAAALSGATLLALGLPLTILLAVIQLVLVENLYRGTDTDSRWHVGLACIALGSLAVYDLIMSADAVLTHRVATGLVAGRAGAAIFVAPLLAVAAARNPTRNIKLNATRTAAFHSAVLIMSGVFLISLAAVAELVGRYAWLPGSDWSTLIEVCLVFAGGLAIAVILVSASTRHWLARLVAQHFFTYRYDYRREWLACIATLSASDQSEPDGLRRRAVRALADIVDSPAGLLLEGEPNQPGLAWSGSWNLPAIGPIAPGHTLLDALRRAPCLELTEPIGGLGLWLAISLPGEANRLAGCVLLAPPRGPFQIDDEVRALLGVVAREVATRLAEQRATRALLETRDLRAYGERFAFVAHDIKNVAGQLRLLTSNARQHMSNPEFQADMLATVDASVQKIGRLIRRLEVVEGEDGPAASDLHSRIAQACAHRQTGTTIIVPMPSQVRVAMAEPDLDATLTHLIDNAVTAAGPSGTVSLSIAEEGGRLALDIVDDGPGMTAEFVRDELFRPFRSRTEGGSGIGAFQARELLRRCGGDLLVSTRQGGGTRMRLLLPRAGALENLALSA